jgi:hypothetical protein
MFSQRSLRLFLVPAALAGLLVACGSDETDPGQDHTPTDYNIIIDGQAASAPYIFVSGQTARVQVKFFNRAGEDLDDVEDSHFGLITFSPSSLASVSRVSGHNYQFDVTGGTSGTGTLVVSFGHEDPPDETDFPSEAVTVDPSGGGNPQ